MEVRYSQSAIKSIDELSDFITHECGMPSTAKIFLEKLILFGEGIANNPEIYTICKYPKWANQKLQCAIFKKKWVFAFKVKNNFVVIFYLKNGKALNY